MICEEELGSEDTSLWPSAFQEALVVKLSYDVCADEK